MGKNGKNTLLLVEDNLDVQELTKELFVSEGYDVFCAFNGKEALDFLRTDSVKVDLILLDLKMPVMDGHQFRREQLLDAKLAAIPVIILSADGNSKIKADQMGVQDFCNKSSGIEEMLEVVKRNCDLKG